VSEVVEAEDEVRIEWKWGGNFWMHVLHYLMSRRSLFDKMLYTTIRLP
jgi:hypothetical protein